MDAKTAKEIAFQNALPEIERTKKFILECASQGATSCKIHARLLSGTLEWLKENGYECRWDGVYHIYWNFA